MTRQSGINVSQCRSGCHCRSLFTNPSRTARPANLFRQKRRIRDQMSRLEGENDSMLSSNAVYSTAMHSIVPSHRSHISHSHHRDNIDLQRIDQASVYKIGEIVRNKKAVGIMDWRSIRHCERRVAHCIIAWAHIHRWPAFRSPQGDGSTPTLIEIMTERRPKPGRRTAEDEIPGPVYCGNFLAVVGLNP
jgi:hypothetical protein